MTDTCMLDMYLCIIITLLAIFSSLSYYEHEKIKRTKLPIVVHEIATTEKLRNSIANIRDKIDTFLYHRIGKSEKFYKCLENYDA